MIDLYYWPTPNGKKIAIFLEETGLEYRVIPVDIRTGAQFEPDFLAISPNNKIPAMVDPNGPDGQPVTVFESGAMLTYLAEKTGQFWPENMAERYRVISWLFFQMASLGPMFGQAGHFRNHAKENPDAGQDYALERFGNEQARIFAILEERLGEVSYVAGHDYSIADMAIWPWVLPDYQKLDLAANPNIARWHRAIGDRPAVVKAMEVGADWSKNQPAMTQEQKDLLYGKGQLRRGKS